MKRTILVVLALLLIVPAASAQTRFFDLTANAVWLDPTGGGSFEDLSDPADIDIDAETETDRTEAGIETEAETETVTDLQRSVIQALRRSSGSGLTIRTPRPVRG